MAIIKEVTKYADVFVASVSRYINKNGYVRAETGEKIAEGRFMHSSMSLVRLHAHCFKKNQNLLGRYYRILPTPIFYYLQKE